MKHTRGHLKRKLKAWAARPEPIQRVVRIENDPKTHTLKREVIR